MRRFECTVGGAPLVYFDTVDSVGHFIELWDNNQVYLDLFSLVEDAPKAGTARSRETGPPVILHEFNPRFLNSKARSAFVSYE